MGAHRFELIGGDPVLDFLNTIHDWTVAEPLDHLHSFGDTLDFGVATGLLSHAEVRNLRNAPASGEFLQLRALRASLEGIFRALVTRHRPPSKDLDALARQAALAAGTAQLLSGKERIARAISLERAGVATLRWRLAEAAVSLLTAPRIQSLKACPRCGWFFLDQSKNGSRRWCSMATCGSSAKAHSYYWRRRVGRSS